MKRVILFILIFLLSASAEAAYKIYLKNGSVISDVDSYEERGEEVNIFFSTGSMMILKKDILKIEGKESMEREIPATEIPEVQQKKDKPEETAVQPQSREPDYDKTARINSLRTELDSVITEIKAVQEEESRLVATINEKQGRRFNYNLIQLKQLEKELEPLRQDLSTVQQKKAELQQKKSSIESEINSLQ